MSQLLGASAGGGSPAAPAVAAGTPSMAGMRPSDVTEGMPPMGAGIPPELQGMPPELLQAIMAMAGGGLATAGGVSPSAGPMSPPAAAPGMMPDPNMAMGPPTDVLTNTGAPAQTPLGMETTHPAQFGVAEAHETWRQGFWSANGRFPTPTDVANRAWTMDFTRRVGRLPTKLEYIMQTQPPPPPDGAPDFM